MLNFEELTIQNFLIFGKKQTIKFDKTGVRYIYGENLDILAADTSGDEEIDERDVSSGSGKSSLPIALLFAIYGEVKKKNKIPLTRVANKKYKKNVEVTTTFNIDNKDRYLVKRYRAFKPHGNTVYLYKWDKSTKTWTDLSRSDSNETQELINKIVGYNFQTAMKVILFSRDDVQDYLDLPIADRFKVIENIVQLNKFKEKYDIVYKRKLDLEKKIVQINNSIEVNNRVKSQALTWFKTEKNAIKSNRERNKNRITELEQRLSSLGDVDTIEQEIKNIIDLYKEQINVASDFLQYETKIKVLQKDVDIEKKQKDSTFKLIENYKKDLSAEPKKCKACGEIQDKDHYLEHKQSIEKFINIQTQALQKLIDNIEKIQSEIENYKSLKDEAKQTILDINTKIKASSLSENIKKIIYSEIKQGKEVALHAEVIEINNELNQLKSTIESKDRIKELTKSVRNLVHENIILKKDLAANSKQLNICLIWIKVLDVREETSIKQLVISKIVPAFNSILQIILDDIYNGLIHISFDSQLNEKIIYEGEEAQISELSTGERTRINLCINLTAYELTRINLNASNLIFMDEVFNSMDVYSINKFINMIKNKYAKNSLVHIVSHSKGVEENLDADEIIKIQRKDRESEIIFV